MGAWSATIMGGDTPLDVEFYILEKLGFTDDEINNNEITDERLKSELQKQQLDVLKYLQTDDMDFEGEQLLVLGYMLVTNGCAILPEVKETIMEACDEDEWAQSDEERAGYVEDLKQKVEANTGQPVKIKNEGLFEKLAEHLASGKTGLLNK